MIAPHSEGVSPPEARAGFASGPRPRSLPLRIPPVAGESFPSYIDRLAHDIRSPTLVLLQATGVAGIGGARAFPSGFGVFMHPARLEAFCRSADLPRETVSGMLLTAYDGVCLDFSGFDPEKPRAVMSADARRWAYFYGSHACPRCLMESEGVWKLSWKLPWVFACTKHRALLVGSCPKCGRRLRAGRPRNPNLPDSTLHIPEPMRCSTLVPSEVPAAIRGSAPCGHPLHEADLFPEHASLDLYPRLIEAQGRIDAALSRETCPGEANYSREWFTDLGVLSVLLLSYGSEELEAEDGPAPVREALEAQRVRREGSPVRWRSGVQERIPWGFRHAGPPEKPALLAAVVSEATRILARGTAEETADALGSLAVRVRAGVGNRERGYDMARRTLKSASPALALAFESVWTKRGGPPAKMAAKRLRRTVPVRFANLSPDHVPQLFWKEEFEETLAELLPGVGERYARRHCSLAFVRQMGNYAWKEAALLLGMPQDKGESAANRCSSVLRRNGNIEEFYDRVNDLVRRMAGESVGGPGEAGVPPAKRRTDYGARRRALADFEAVPWAEWSAMCREAGQGRQSGRRGTRDRAAAAHIWYALAGGDPYLSPAIWRKDARAMRVTYSKLARDITPELEGRLLRYGRSLLPEELREPEEPADG